MKIYGPSSEGTSGLIVEQIVTANKQGSGRTGLDVNAKTAFNLIDNDLLVGAGSTASVINYMNHNALVGDVIRFTLGDLINIEAVVDSITTNTMTLAQLLPSTPETDDTFSIYRPAHLVMNTSGGIQVTTVDNFDYVAATYPLSYVETYTYRNGGPAGALVATVTVTYQDATKERVVSVYRT